MSLIQFKFKLFYSLVLFFLNYILYGYKHLLSLFGIVLIILGLTLVITRSPKTTFELPLVDNKPVFTPAIIKNVDEKRLKIEQLSTQEIEDRIVIFQSILEVQPTHFDSLVALSFLYGAKNNQEKSLEMWGRAKDLDPNNPIFH